MNYKKIKSNTFYWVDVEDDDENSWEGIVKTTDDLPKNKEDTLSGIVIFKTREIPHNSYNLDAIEGDPADIILYTYEVIKETNPEEYPEYFI